MSRILVAFLTCLLLVGIHQVSSFPNGAGDCPEGEAAVGGPHLTAESVTEGTWEEGLFFFSINDTPYFPGVPIDLPIGETHTWLLTSNDVQYRGFLFRLSGGDSEIDASEALTSSNPLAQEATACSFAAEGVAGITHVDREYKTTMDGELFLEEPSNNMLLDVTIVVENRVGLSFYYYTSFVINAIDGEVIESPAEEVAVSTSSPVEDSNVTDSSTLVPSEAGTADEEDTTIGPESESSATEASTTNVPETAEPSTEFPDTTDTPSEPEFDDSSTEDPSTEEPETDGPTTEAPTTDAPDTVDPTTDARDTDSPATEDPTTSVPDVETTDVPSDYEGTALPTDGGDDATYAPDEATAIPSADDTTIVASGVPQEGLLGTTISPTEELIPFSDADCTPETPCPVCSGDCNSDDDCEGDLACFRRTGISVIPVPGCAGEGVPGKDYCYVPADNILHLRETQCSEENPCAVCQGDCDNDFQCAEGLSCYQARDSEKVVTVPGCEGIGSPGLDYCYNWNGCSSDEECPELPCLEEPCDQHVCRDGDCVVVASCGSNLCDVGEYCCNESCGICAPMDGGCTQQFCTDKCGPVTCQPGDVCCNESCGICTAPRDTCSDEICDDEGDIRTRFLRAS